MIQSVLIANRGEIAVRIIQACRELGLRSVAVFSEADAGALHVRLADAACAIGPAPVRESYLVMDNLIAAALAEGVDAIHPGYGMLSENAEFAERVAAAGLVFIGPTPAVIARMGDKTSARAEAIRCGLPVLPGSDGPVSDPAAAAELADRIGYPVVVKASFGGGGRGMRVANSPEDLSRALADAARESGLAFGRSEVFLEKYIARPRHVEVQILADAQGTVLHLGDRDCTVQRRHQKLMEEAPAPDLPADLRAGLAAAAVKLAAGIGYTGAGTVEFLYDPAAAAFYFLEVNTRLQVEHGVTELVTGLDLVAAQIRIAAGQPLGLMQSDITLRGHAIQARIAAEDPFNDFRPTPGQITALELPTGSGLRTDFGVQAGDTISQQYDSMFGKIHAVAADRAAAIRRLDAALARFRVAGISSTAPFLRQVLASDEFGAVRHDTGSVARDWTPLPDSAPPVEVAAPAPGAERWVAIATTRGIIDVAIPLSRSAGAAVTLLAGARPNRQAGASAVAGGGVPVASMDSVVARVEVAAGDHVAKGAVIAVLEAMKMEMPVRATADLIVETVLVTPGQAVRAGAALVRLA